MLATIQNLQELAPQPGVAYNPPVNISTSLYNPPNPQGYDYTWRFAHNTPLNQPSAMLDVSQFTALVDPPLAQGNGQAIPLQKARRIVGLWIIRQGFLQLSGISPGDIAPAARGVAGQGQLAIVHANHANFAAAVEELEPIATRLISLMFLTALAVYNDGKPYSMDDIRTVRLMSTQLGVFGLANSEDLAEHWARYWPKGIRVEVLLAHCMSNRAKAYCTASSAGVIAVRLPFRIKGCSCGEAASALLPRVVRLKSVGVAVTSAFGAAVAGHSATTRVMAYAAARAAHFNVIAGMAPAAAWGGVPAMDGNGLLLAPPGGLAASSALVIDYSKACESALGLLASWMLASLNSSWRQLKQAAKRQSALAAYAVSKLYKEDGGWCERCADYVDTAITVGVAAADTAVIIANGL
jgi:hypothetical protein